MSVSINSYGAQYERKRLAQDHSARSYHSQSFGADQRLRERITGPLPRSLRDSLSSPLKESTMIA